MKKRSCDGCVALYDSGDLYDCDLRYMQRTEKKTIGDFSYRVIIPVTECPKPMTKKELAKIKKKQR